MVILIALMTSNYATADFRASLQDAIETFLHYLYYDEMDPRISAQHVVAVLHVAHYYGAGRLVALCEAVLAKELKRGDKDDEGNLLDARPQMLLQARQIDSGVRTCSSLEAKPEPM